MSDPIHAAGESAPWLLQVLQSLQATGAANALRESDVAFSVIEALHILGMLAVVGTVVIVDLRLLGLWSRVPVTSFNGPAILRITWAGFALMVLTGLPLAASEAPQLYGNAAFRIKLLLLALLGLNQWIVRRLERRAAADPSGRDHALLRAGAALSLFGWAGVIIAGRTIAYL
jgi:hypothetical protein